MLTDYKNKAQKPEETKENVKDEKCGCTCHPYQLPPFFSNYSVIKCGHCAGGK